MTNKESHLDDLMQDKNAGSITYSELQRTINISRGPFPITRTALLNNPETREIKYSIIADLARYSAIAGIVGLMAHSAYS